MVLGMCCTSDPDHLVLSLFFRLVCHSKQVLFIFQVTLSSLFTIASLPLPLFPLVFQVLHLGVICGSLTEEGFQE